MLQDNSQESSQRQKEWKEIEDLVMQYQQAIENEDKQSAAKPAGELLKRFSPLFKKYIVLFRTGQIDFNDKEMKLFVLSFMDDPRLQRALRREKQKAEYRSEIYRKFNFIKETYGHLSEEEILTDLQMSFLLIAKRYKPIGKNFCAYLYNTYHYEIARNVKKFIKNPINIHYKNYEYEDAINGENDMCFEHALEDTFYEDSMGMPDLSWISGKNCSEVFSDLTPLERKILVKYYLEEWNDRQIAEAFNIHINTVNQKRRAAVALIAKKMDINVEDIKRNRRSGKHAILPTNI